MMHNDSVRSVPGASEARKVLHPPGASAPYQSTERRMAEPAQGQDAFHKPLPGDRAAFAELVRKHQAMVFSIALHSLRDAALGRGTGSGGISRFLQPLRDFQSAAHVEFWLRKVASRRCIDYVRRRRRQPSIGLEDAPELATATRGTGSVSVGNASKTDGVAAGTGADGGVAPLSGGSRAGRDRRDHGYSFEQREKLSCIARWRCCERSWKERRCEDEHHRNTERL